MTAFIITTIVIFMFSALSNLLYIVNQNTDFKIGAAIGLMLFTGMIAWAFTLLL